MEKLFITFDKKTIYLIRIAILISIVVMLICAGCVIAFTVSQWRNSYLRTQSQLKYDQALIENVGKPQIIEQRYFSAKGGEL